MKLQPLELANQVIKLQWTRPKLCPLTVQKRVNHAGNHALAKAREGKGRTTTLPLTKMLNLVINQQRKKNKLLKSQRSRRSSQKVKRRRRLVEEDVEDVVGAAAGEVVPTMTMKKKRLRRFPELRERRRRNPLNKKNKKLHDKIDPDVKDARAVAIEMEVTVKAVMTKVIV